MPKSNLLIRHLALAVFLSTLVYIPLRIAIARFLSPQPELILMLGGGRDREQFTAEFARINPHLKVWLSSGSKEALQDLRDAKISRNRIYFDCRATDTVTNFTTVANDLEQMGIRHIYLVTSDYHLPRASAIATLVLGSRGITFTPISVPGIRLSEHPLRILRDVGRSVLWLVTGRTAARFKPVRKICLPQQQFDEQ